MKTGCGVAEVELIINYDGTDSHREALSRVGRLVTPLIAKTEELSETGAITFGFNFFGDRVDPGKWAYDMFNQTCHMPIIPPITISNRIPVGNNNGRARIPVGGGDPSLAEDNMLGDNILSRIEDAVASFSPIPGGIFDPAEDSLGSLYSVLKSRVKINDDMRSDKSRLGLLIVVTVTDNKAHYAEDHTLPNQGALPFPQWDGELTCELGYSYVPISELQKLATQKFASNQAASNQAASNQAASTPQKPPTKKRPTPNLTHLSALAPVALTYTVPEYVPWWSWTYERIGFEHFYVASSLPSILSKLDEIACSVQPATQNTQEPDGVRNGVRKDTHRWDNGGWEERATAWEQEKPATDAVIEVLTTSYPVPAGWRSGPKRLSSPAWIIPSRLNSHPTFWFRSLTVLALIAIFIAGWTLTHCRKPLQNMARPTTTAVSMAPAETLNSDLRDEVATINSEQYI
ncbi:putative transmembrane protein [Gregarina niphandrodes]|uniref:Transmembrane protein n=1 Tax=Gregarina niphandrodes TaxID=110365 RepID=A0A023B934_GRENI|nr:putative transmembrane protein [Gregarina niphandrodes]EZG70698.1 putative transmembrane protein [Gregarina niphandrodes]|eukprot:XP_011129881.1 putative transmembrane protein [Gregarina niphandrodes]